jgi:hypothetical protein
VWRTSDTHNWVSSGRQRHVDRCIRDHPKDKWRPVKDVLPFRPGGDEITFSRATVAVAEAEVGKSRRLRSGCRGGMS